MFIYYIVKVIKTQQLRGLSKEDIIEVIGVAILDMNNTISNRDIISSTPIQQLLLINKNKYLLYFK